jgi:hypothetical protein
MTRTINSTRIKFQRNPTRLALALRVTRSQMGGVDISAAVDQANNWTLKSYISFFYFCLKSHAPYSWDLKVEIALSPRHLTSLKFHGQSLSQNEKIENHKERERWNRVSQPQLVWEDQVLWGPPCQITSCRTFWGGENWGIFFWPFFPFQILY